ncbi:sulfatase-like hydrolase/transferase [Vibrio vulnificus]|nr:sulfatase-like hydrolase/transferase [Vibrio vulnificus]EJC6744757.1 sulfatase-like hydrolase/transferase [Vibrio vulnificus]EJC6821096.1 sulfatase-like hydrolase/transferase [Vibrio vulnificus]EJC6953741.1 sulfatase-like hydrolase/transferase [Vibrio vulnificus]EJC6959285.1 sulfatase-like hydrolase/transferase [Vibrio vulnificus]
MTFLVIPLIIIVFYLNFLVLRNIFYRSKVKSAVNKSIYSALYCVGFVYICPEGSLYLSLTLSVLYFLNAYYSSIYGELTYGSAASVFETNREELKEFINSINKLFILKILTLSFIYFCSIFLLSKTVFLFSNYISWFSVGVSFLYVVSLYKIYWSNTSTKEFWTKPLRYNAIFNAIYHVCEYFKYKRMLKNIKIESEWTDVTRHFHGKCYVIIIGESACKSHFHFYGYDVKNTPSFDDLVGYKVVKDPIAPAAQTMTSLPRMLAVNNKSEVNFNLNIIDLANNAGFETYWLSNQGELGLADTDITILAKRAKYTTFLQKEYNKAGSDFKLIEKVENIISQSSKRDKVIFLHTMGSHWDFCERSNSGDYKFKDDLVTQIDFYDNTIHNTYMMIEDLRAVFKRNSIDCDFVYFSDHALVHTTDYPYLTHGVGKMFSLEAVQVPLLFVSERMKNCNLIDKKYYMRDFVHTLAHWMGIEANEIDYNYSVLSKKLEEQENYIMDDSLNVITLEGVEHD